ncbi:MAG: hypothetical protein ABR549_01620 [Mycobacteriales bacterium]
MRPGRRIAELAADEPALALVWSVVLSLVAGTAVLTADRRVWAYLTVCLVLTAVVATAHAAARFSRGLLAMLLVLGCLHMAGGLLPSSRGVLYDYWLVDGVLKYDQAVHVFGSLAATWASWQLAGRYLDLVRTPPRAQALIACLGGMGKGAVNEVVEFLSGGTHTGGYANTGWDLVFDLAGCAAMAVYLVQSRADRRTPVSGMLPDRAPSTTTGSSVH